MARESHHADGDREEADGADEHASRRRYDELKEHQGRKYRGMRVGGRHSWDYDVGRWNEKKVAPDKWEFTYAVPKRRRGRAPPGSGVPVGTEYRWFIVAEQHVRKTDANTYTTRMEGTKYKLAHRRADSDAWSIRTAKGERERLLRFLEDAADRIRGEIAADEGRDA